MKNPYVLHFNEIARAQVELVGGKGAALGELSRIRGVRVPPGFCVTTDAYRRAAAGAASMHDVETLAIPVDITDAITRALSELGAHSAYAVRSSATAEDSPTMSFAGQHDSYLNVTGIGAILDHVRRCWASLFTERAVAYRQRNGIDDARMLMAVVVQRMVQPQASGILFTADPITGNRSVSSVDATAGLGDALVSGLVNPDTFKVRDGKVIDRHKQQDSATLTDAQVVRLSQLGRRIEAHFGSPQDIEWCLADDDFYIVQSRPITTLFPVPVAADNGNHVYVSVGHQQMMTDPFKPLGLSVWQMTTPRPMAEAGGRLFVDVAPQLALPASGAALIGAFQKSDPLMGDAMQTVVDRGFIPTRPEEGPAWALPGAGAAVDTDAAIPAALIEQIQTSLAQLREEIRAKSGVELLDFIRAHIQANKGAVQDPRSMQVIMTGMEAAWWLNDKLNEWLGEKNAADTLTQSVANNVTSEMGLALLDVADAIRPHPEVVAFLKSATGDGFLNELPRFPGGREARDAIQGWLDKYGMRGVGEIDITRPRWSERPALLLPIILGHVESFEPGAARRHFEQGLEEARKKEQNVLQRLRAMPDGEQKAADTKRMIDRVRTFAGYREYPKYAMISRYFIYKQALMKEADRLVAAGVLRDREDIFFLRFDEIREVLQTNRVDQQLISERKEAYKSYKTMTPPRVMTSEGEIISGSYRRGGLPAGALVGLPVSAGTVEGRARVILDMGKADLEPGDILVTTFTDPSWTPLFVAIAGLITEVGGLMTHGAVIAREYGLPAVVGVENATRLIRDGQRIRVHGTEGYVELF